MKKLYEFKDVNNGAYKLIHVDVMNIIEQNKDLFKHLVFLDPNVGHQRELIS